MRITLAEFYGGKPRPGKIVCLAGNIILVPLAMAGAGGMHHMYRSIGALRGPGSPFLHAWLPAPGLGGLTMLAFVVQGLFFAASPTGGEGFTAQRFMAARNEFHAQVGQLMNTLLTLIVRVVPFLLLGMVAAALYAPGSVREPGELWARLVQTYAPAGLKGLLVAGVFAAYMATISTEMNWGASYIVNDLYRPLLRPGYADQWLLPLFEEVATRYDLDGVHHDYVRYPGDVAPDSYCFCDYCLRQIPRYALLRYEARSGERYRVNPVLPRIEANWWSDPTMLPVAWDGEDRREKADFLLNGRTAPGGPPDLRYFCYEYRADQIQRWVREVHDDLKRLKPGLEISAAVFKNPIQSARFIGQKWNEWTDWIDVFMPMTYRSHFAGGFAAYLDHLEETTRRQIEWTRHLRPIYAGIATDYLYREEMQPVEELAQKVEALKAGKPAAMRGECEAMVSRLAPLDAARAREFEAACQAASAERLAGLLAGLRNDPPPGFFPPEKLTRSIDAARKASPDGIVIFAAGSVSREKLWPALEEAFGGK